MEEKDFFDKYYNPTMVVQEFLKEEEIGRTTKTRHTINAELINILKVSKDYFRINSQKVKIKKDSIVLISPCERVELEMVYQDYLEVFNDKGKIISIIKKIDNELQKELDDFETNFEGNSHYLKVLTWVHIKVLDLKDKYIA